MSKPRKKWQGASPWGPCPLGCVDHVGNQYTQALATGERVVIPRGSHIVYTERLPKGAVRWLNETKTLTMGGPVPAQYLEHQP